MPAPPPYGVSSTVRCRSWVQSRRSCTWTSSRPLSRALPAQRELQRGEVVGEDRDDVDASRRAQPRRPRGRRDQAGPVGDHDPAGGEVDLGHQRLDERHQGVAAVGRADPSRSWAPPCTTRGDLAERARRRRRTPPARPAGGRRTRRGPPGLVGRDRVSRAGRCRGPPRPRCGRGSPRSAPAAPAGASGCRTTVSVRQRRWPSPAGGSARSVGRRRSGGRARRCGRRR